MRTVGVVNVSVFWENAVDRVEEPGVLHREPEVAKAGPETNEAPERLNETFEHVRPVVQSGVSESVVLGTRLAHHNIEFSLFVSYRHCGNHVSSQIDAQNKYRRDSKRKGNDDEQEEGDKFGDV